MISVILLFLCLQYAHAFELVSKATDHDLSWDYLILTQRWPVSICIEWIHKKAFNHCNYPKKKYWWTVHGIWAAKVKSVGPNYCNGTWVFDPEQIKPIENDLEQAWTNIFEENLPYSLWEHEWNKHGTCSATLKLLDSQIKYFIKGIDWNKEYPLIDILSAAKILPSKTRNLTVTELYEAVKAHTGKLPTVVCLSVDGVQYLLELGICFDKTMNLIDCEEVNEFCDVSKGIIYPVEEQYSI